MKWKSRTVLYVFTGVILITGILSYILGWFEKGIYSYNPGEVYINIEGIEDSMEPIGARAEGVNTVEFDKDNKQYIFTYSSELEKVEYIISLESERVKNGLVSIEARIDDKDSIFPIYDGGTVYKNNDFRDVPPLAFSEAAEVEFKHGLKKGILNIDYDETFEGVTTSKQLSYYIKGKSLVVRITSEGTNYKTNYTGIDLGRGTNIPNPRIQDISQADGCPAIVVDNDYFYSTFIDRVRTNATGYSYNVLINNDNDVRQGYETRYTRDSANQINPLDETVYVTLSNDILDCIYITNKTKSDHRDSLTDKVLLDYWQFNETWNQRYGKFENWADVWKMDNIFLIIHEWQRYGYDINLPAHYPANPARGSDEDLKRLISTLKDDYGWMVGLHEDYWFIYPHESNPYWNEEGQAKLAKSHQMQYLAAWHDGKTQTYSIAAGYMKYFAQLESPRIKEAYNTNALFLDVNGGFSPDQLNQITFDADSPYSRSIRQAVQENKELFEYLRSIYDGPIFSEGTPHKARHDKIYAGYIDGVEAQTIGRLDAPLTLDYELKYIRPLMSNQGMGYYNRAWSGEDYALMPWDRYNAMTIAFGHSGIIYDYITFKNNLPHYHAKTYYLFQKLQSQYLDTSAKVEIKYWDGNKFMNLSQAVREEYDFNRARIHKKYSNGLEMYLNFDGENWVVNMDDDEYILDTNGWVAKNDEIGFIAYSSLIDGNRVDYVDCTEYTFADARGNMTDFGTFTTNGMKIVRKDTEDTTAPVISNASIENREGSLVITWDTDKYASSIIEYGVESDFDSVITPPLDYRRNHSITISDLIPGVEYHFRAVSEDISGNVVKSEVFRLIIE